MESWGTHGTLAKHYRKGVWGTWDMLRLLLSDRNAWKQLIKLDPVTGLDPEGIKLRASEGFTGAEYILPGYWIWAKVIENLSAIGYDSNTMYMASYDWRLALGHLEVRDQYFSRLKTHIESMKQASGQKAVVIGHSMGSTVLYYFLKWVESDEGGKGGDQWVEDHVEHLINIGGALLGAPKVLATLLTGENHDILSMGKIALNLFERFLCRGERLEIFRNWASAACMLPKGGNLIWGDMNGAPDDDLENPISKSLGQVISFSPDHSSNKKHNDDIQPNTLLNYTVDSAMRLFETSASPEYLNVLHNNYSFGISTSKKEIKANDNIPRTWNNPLEASLPKAPSMKVYCLYGIGIPTERGYIFAPNDPKKDKYRNEETCNARGDIQNTAGETTDMPLFVDTAATESDMDIKKGFRFTNGDRTIPLMSNGYMCAPSGGWMKHADLYNPGHSQVIGREYQDVESKGPAKNRGAPTTAKHVEILGNADLLLDLLKIASNRSETVTQRIYSNIDAIAQRIPIEHHD
ncbi:phospholipid/diacylglycerol acyltransferase [Absidia repens]|uniref:Phospholipid/diacylglycerol acyltransferase n=1 Tax=Absidia repens TaxID=90262 RepID=A0A1X2IKA2_9FUNG|nr:phospholipid/diacylglycerol acyltransferase [Absidia repens]